MATLVARCCRKANHLQSVQGYGKQRTHKNVYKSKKQTKKVLRCCRKTNQLKSMQGFGMQRFPRNIFKPKKHKKLLPWQHLLPGVVEKLINSNLCSGMESKEPIKIFTSPRNKKKCCHGNTCCQVCQKRRVAHAGNKVSNCSH